MMKMFDRLETRVEPLKAQVKTVLSSPIRTTGDSHAPSWYPDYCQLFKEIISALPFFTVQNSAKPTIPISTKKTES